MHARRVLCVYIVKFIAVCPIHQMCVIEQIKHKVVTLCHLQGSTGQYSFWRNGCTPAGPLISLQLATQCVPILWPLPGQNLDIQPECLCAMMGDDHGIGIYVDIYTCSKSGLPKLSSFVPEKMASRCQGTCAPSRYLLSRLVLTITHRFWPLFIFIYRIKTVTRAQDSLPIQSVTGLPLNNVRMHPKTQEIFKKRIDPGQPRGLVVSPYSYKRAPTIPQCNLQLPPTLPLLLIKNA